MSSQVWPHPLALGQEELVTSMLMSFSIIQLHMFNRQVRFIMLEVCVLFYYIIVCMLSSSTVSAYVLMLYTEHSRYIVHTDSKCNECVHQCLWLIGQLVVFYGTHCMLTVTNSDLITSFLCVCVCVWMCGCVDVGVCM